MRTLPYVVPALLLACAATQVARAADWVDRRLTNGSMHVQAEAGYGIGLGARTSELSAPSMAGADVKGSGFHLGASLGLPLGFELGARVGFRVGDEGRAARGDEFGRAFDFNTYGAGSQSVSNPEISLRSSLFAQRIVELAAESRFAIPVASGSSFGMTPGLALRLRVPSVMRFDTGVYVPLVLNDARDYGFMVPAHLWFQISNFYVGALSGVKIYRQPFERVDVTAGIGAGVTLGGIFDVRLQVVSQRINDENWRSATGLGLSVGVMTP